MATRPVRFTIPSTGESTYDRRMNEKPSLPAWSRLTRAAQRAASRQRDRRELGRQTSAASLQRSAREAVGDAKLVIASHREPYQHVRRDGTVVAIRSAGGLAPALDSVARATGATWVALAAGDADRETADAAGRIALPPGDPRYTLQRLWIDPEELVEDHGLFANGCLWPLCHVVYVRPSFNVKEWNAYREVNRRFAEAVLSAIGDEPAVVLLQDYHLALAARTLRERRPDLTLVLFWHIPWPNPEVFRILPWKEELLDGLLATDLLGFHIQYDTLNFLETVTRELEVHYDRERAALTRGGHRTYVRSYPIAPDAAEIAVAAGSPDTRRQAAVKRKELGLEGTRVILGVDRLDYTKGIPERLDAFERFLDLRLPGSDDAVMVQLGVPTRVNLPDYQALAASVEERIARLNRRFEWRGRPVAQLHVGNLGFDELIPFYLLAEVMAVTSLHDGMNLVAKEYVATRVEDDGALVLSPYTGASRELAHAIQESPYEAEALAGAFSRALTLSREEAAERMRALRETVAGHNIYDWGRALFRDLRRLHLLPSARGTAAPRR
jgi:trehalose 6-phosphate synthase